LRRQNGNFVSEHRIWSHWKGTGAANAWEVSEGLIEIGNLGCREFRAQRFVQHKIFTFPKQDWIACGRRYLTVLVVLWKLWDEGDVAIGAEGDAFTVFGFADGAEHGGGSLLRALSARLKPCPPRARQL
jgi:hypothetical protein